MVLTHPDGTQPKDPNSIWVFGSNLAGRHGAGAALVAIQHYGAKYGIPLGLQERSWAIPTKDEKLNVLPLKLIKLYIDTFLETTRSYQETRKFFVTSIGCGLAGYKARDIAPMFNPVFQINQHVYSFPAHWLKYMEVHSCDNVVCP